jgi:hypothetical protein
MLSGAIFLLLFCIPVKAQDEQLKAIFVYNFTRYVSWPQKEGNFIIVVLGKSPIYNELVNIATKKKVGTLDIEVKTINTPEEITNCHMVYVPYSKTGLLPDLLPRARNNHIFIISEKEGSCKSGAGINFTNKDGKLSFEISKTNLDNCGLTVSQGLMKLGVVVE